jgi:hypothetical protein
VTYKVVQWATGSVGADSLRLLLDRPDVEVVGVFAYSDDKNGVDAGELVGRAPIGVKATTNRDEILALDADVVLHNALLTPTGWPEMDADVLSLLRAGKNVISTASYFFPSAHGDAYLQQFEEAAKDGGVTLFGTGINPGLILDRLPATISTLCSDIKRIDITENSNVASHPSAAMVFEQMGMGQDPDTFTKDAAIGDMFQRMFGEVVYLLGDYLGVKIEGLDVELKLGLATRDLDISAGHVKKGTIAGTRWTLNGLVDGEPFIAMHEGWHVDNDLPDWEKRRVWSAKIEGTPSWLMELTVARTWTDESVPFYNALLHSTAAVAVQAIDDVVDAPPGVLKPPVFDAWVHPSARPRG